jgi:hypothetical protein
MITSPMGPMGGKITFPPMYTNRKNEIRLAKQIKNNKKKIKKGEILTKKRKEKRNMSYIVIITNTRRKRISFFFQDVLVIKKWGKNIKIHS